MAPEPSQSPDADAAGGHLSLDAPAFDTDAVLPDRRSLSPIGADVVIPANPGIAADVLADDSRELGADASAPE